ncbi:hypothetical protein ACFOOK_26365 [Micromonospora krabiensis]|uniref:Uncharacterized protein n=1 Tax=Micromonospora krabiensis TaxID=307121 RepID=A0A1C3N5Q9_9ACTN|nr:hypothetical protein [Micromonospora krabiensis]SBV27908.1 hypothetical protein GA0070620_3439 [Micromonospora krabiensis]
MKKTMLTASLLALLAAFFGALIGWGVRGLQPPRPMQPCATEDSSAEAREPCYFRATDRGNGRGTSFVIDGTGRTISLPSNP